MDKFSLSWKQLQPIFFDTEEHIVDIEGEKYTFTKVKDIENISYSKAENYYNNDGILVIKCKENNKQYSCHYNESGDKDDMEMFIGGDFDFKLYNK
jgi:hypothetical protein